MRGLVSEVNVVPVRAFLTVEALTGGLTLTVTEGAPFAVAGARAVLAGQTYGIDSMLPGAGEDDPDVLVLDSPVVAGAEEGEPVDALPRVEATTAVVTFPDGSVIEDVAVGRNDQGQTDLAPGSYEGEDRPTVEVEFRNGQHEVTWVEGRGQIDGSFIDPPVPVQPASSPEPTVVGLLGQLLVTVPGVDNATPVLYEYHASKVAGFTPAESTMWGPATSATGVAITSLPDGTPLEYDVTYYVRVVATSGPLAADPSPAVEGRMNRAGTPDIEVGAITGVQFSSIVTMATLFRTAETGQRIEWDSDSIRILDPTGAVKVSLAWDDIYLDARRVFARSLETGGARFGGVSEFAQDGTSKLSSGRIQEPALALEHKSVPLRRVSVAGSPSGRIFADESGDLWRVGVRDGSVVARRTSGGTVTEVALGPVNGSGTPLSAEINSNWLYVASASTIRAFPRTAPVAFSAPAVAPVPAAPGTGGYADGEPIIGLQRGTGDVLVAHRVQGAQTIGGSAYGNGEVMVRKYAPSASGSTLTLTLNKTIGPVIAPLNGGVSSVLMDSPGGSFDVPTTAGHTALALHARGGLGTFGLNTVLFSVADAGASTTPGFTPGAFSWYDDNSLGLAWDTVTDAFFTTDQSGDAVRFYTNSPVLGNDIWHGYTYVNGAQESMVSPLYKSMVRARHVSRWTIPPLPAGVTQVRVYVASVDGVRTRLERVGTFTGTSGDPLLVEQNMIQPPDGSATNSPPAASDLTAGAPHELYTEAGGTYIHGDGKAGSTVAITDNNQWTTKGYVDAQPVLVLSNAGGQSALGPAQTVTVIGWIEDANDGGFTVQSNGTIILPDSTSWWRVEGTWGFASDATGNRRGLINGEVLFNEPAATGTGQPAIHSGSTLVKGASFVVAAYQSSSGNLALTNHLRLRISRA